MSNVERLADEIAQYYQNNTGRYPVRGFHFASRLWLWTGDKWAREYLDKKSRRYVGRSDEQTLELLRGKLDKAEAVNKTVSYRRAAFKKYPKLAGYNSVLFNVLMAETLYGTNLRPIARQLISDEELVNTYRRLQTDSRSIKLLTTHAVNFFWLTKNYFADNPKINSRLKLRPQKLLKLLSGYQKLEEGGLITHTESIKLQINLLTHVVISQSRFYVDEIHDDIYKKLCAQIEKIIEENYYEVSLDNKFEFLVCARLCGYRTKLAGIITQEAKNSLSPRGNFLVDTLNHLAGFTPKDISGSEHRNVLFIMSQKPWRGDKHLSLPRRMKRTIGSFEKVSFPDFALFDTIAKIDTGATSGAIHATDIKEIQLPTGTKALRFKPFGRSNYVTVNSYSRRKIRSSNGQVSNRYLIPTTIVIQGVQYPINATLADRSLMKKDVLVGRKFLRSHGFMVDVKKGTQYRGLGRTTL